MQPQSLMGTSYQILTGKRDAKEITFFTLQAVLLSGECESPIHLSLANNYADDALRAFLHFLLAFTLVVFVVNLGGESPKQILDGFLLIKLPWEYQNIFDGKEETRFCTQKKRKLKAPRGFHRWKVYYAKFAGLSFSLLSIFNKLFLKPHNWLKLDKPTAPRVSPNSLTFYLNLLEKFVPCPQGSQSVSKVEYKYRTPEFHENLLPLLLIRSGISLTVF